MKKERKEYLKRLILEIREQIDSDPGTIKAKKQFGEDILIVTWINIALLCDVIEQEILNEK